MTKKEQAEKIVTRIIQKSKTFQKFPEHAKREIQEELVRMAFYALLFKEENMLPDEEEVALDFINDEIHAHLPYTLYDTTHRRAYGGIIRGLFYYIGDIEPHLDSVPFVRSLFKKIYTAVKK